MATPWAFFSLTVARCGICCGACSPPSSTTSWPSWRCTGRVRWDEPHNDYADRKNNRQAIKPIHPELEELLKEILSETYGLIVYQEQIMFIAQKVASYTMGKADALRKAMGKKKLEVLEAEYKGFYEGMTANGFSERAVKALWGHHPAVRRIRVQQVACRRLRSGVLLDGLPQGELPGRVHGGPAHLGRRRQGQGCGVSGGLPSSRHHRAAARRQRVGAELASVGSDIRFGLGAVRNVGANVVSSLIATRTEKGRFTDFSGLPEQGRHRRMQ